MSIRIRNSIRDPLTRLYNRSFFYDTLNQQLAKVNAQHPLSVLISDLDHFKRINDSYGHVAGDKVIQFRRLGAGKPFAGR